MVIELGGVWLFVEQMNMNDMLGKIYNPVRGTGAKLHI